MIYVDDLFYSPAFGYNYWCHCTADTLTELHEFADKLRLKKVWFQQKGNRCSHDHYDLTKTKRILALRKGARALSIQEYCEVVRRNNQGALV